MKNLSNKQVTLTDDIAGLLNKEALMLIDRLRCSVERLLSEIEEAEINISYMHAYKPLVKILDDCDAYDRKMEAMGINKHKVLK